MIVGRLAPSPTGRLHLGHARSFLLAWWSARSQGGNVVLRLEDLDSERSQRKFVDLCLRDLEWLGLDWDGPARIQSAGIERIIAAATALEQQGHAYPCVCTRGDLRSQVSAPQLGNVEVRYAGRCRGRFANRREAEVLTGQKAALRFKVPAGFVTVEDSLSGSVDFDVQADVGDFAILRRDGIPSYQLAVSVDDAFDGVTEVVRGDDLLPSAARQLLLNRALGFPEKRYFHVPLVVDEGGRRLAKRCDDLGISTLRDAGVDPRAIVGWVARNSGMPHVTFAYPHELLREFSWKRFPTDRVFFDSAAHDSLLLLR